MNKAVMSLIFMVVTVVAQTAPTSWARMVCMSDSAGKDVYVWGPDTSITLSKVVKVEYGSAGYVVFFKNGKECTLQKPPFCRMEIVTTVDTQATTMMVDSTKSKKSERKEEGKKERK